MVLIKDIQTLVSSYTDQFDTLYVKISDEYYEIRCNIPDPLIYFEKLFYPSGVNNVEILEAFSSEANKNVYNIYLKKETICDFFSSIEENWIYKGVCYPMSQGAYENYEYDEYRAFLQTYSDETSAPHLIITYRENIYIIVDSNEQLDYKCLSRVLREIALRKLENQNYVIFHASTVELNGKGILIIGNSGAGKTTLALSLCQHHKAKFIANDRIALKLDNNGELLAIPFSCAARLNYGTLKTLNAENDYTKWTLTNNIPSENSDWKTFNGDKKLHILPKELKDELNIDVKGDTKIHCVIYPKYVSEFGEPEIINVNESISDLLTANCYTPEDPDFANDWLNIRDLNIEELRGNAELVKRQLLLQTKSYRFSYNFTDYANLLRELLDLIKEDDSRMLKR